MAKKEDDLFKKLTKAMEETQSGKRFQHTIGVSYTAAAMAMRFGTDVDLARLAGLLHDCAKNLEDEKLLKICERNALPVSDIESRNPYLLHGKVGAYLAKEKYEVTDDDVLNAISWHTTGRPCMSDLEKIIFIADYIEPNRKNAPNLQEVRRLAFEDLDKAMIRILKDTMDYLEGGEREIDPMTLKTYEYYSKQ
ncbi:MAG: bis(5'-nucleosyl)-tetraphosphatase (symmetrical) YqeK [Acetatifactor sp.]|nr:bis(5'-nucleosyl)-tetraphosphatase (symmetrical) YqeK [Acetatifactor sp.]